MKRLEGVVKKSRKSSAKREDRITNLPKSIISRILSCLPTTKDAVRTCVLSKDWEFKWTSIYKVKIEDNIWGDKKASFVKYVDRTLLLSHNIRNFRLECWNDEYDPSCVVDWLSAVFRQNVENFELILHHFTYDQRLILPRSLLNSTSLKSLKLVLPALSSCTFKVPSENCFPNLIDLHFCGVEIRNELSNTDTLTFTFPVLEKMELRDCKWVKVKLVEINAPALTKYISETSYNAQVDDYAINIVGGGLTDFQTSGYGPENMFFTGSSVARAALNNTEGYRRDSHSPEIGSRVRNWLNGFQSLEDLKLSGWIAKAIARPEQGLALPMYNKLQRLSLDGCTDIEVLLVLLHAAPYLKSLVFNKLVQSTGNDYEVVGSLPYCLLNELEEVEFAYNGFPSKYGFHLEKFLWKNGLRLKVFHLRGPKKKDLLKVVELLLTFPKGSDCLAFVFH